VETQEKSFECVFSGGLWKLNGEQPEQMQALLFFLTTPSFHLIANIDRFFSLYQPVLALNSHMGVISCSRIIYPTVI
jgi:hypothetical protein